MLLTYLLTYYTPCARFTNNDIAATKAVDSANTTNALNATNKHMWALLCFNKILPFLATVLAHISQPVQCTVTKPTTTTTTMTHNGSQRYTPCARFTVKSGPCYPRVPSTASLSDLSITLTHNIEQKL